jgi:UDP-N-acetylglucosamine 2-epimerase (non-hydrolysing)
MTLRLGGIIRAILDEDTTIVYPCHPRTRAQLERTGLLGDLKSAGNVQLLEPVPYFRMLNLVRNARIVLTDSGGVQKEAFWLNTPCITLRDNTEWTETVDMGANILAGSNPMLIRRAIANVLHEENFKIRISQAINLYNVGRAANRILEDSD